MSPKNIYSLVGIFFLTLLLSATTSCVTLPSSVASSEKIQYRKLAPLDEAKFAFFSGQMADLKGDFHKAVKFYYQALEYDPQSLTIRRYLIGDLIRLERFHEARQEYNQIIEADSGDSQSRYMLGQLFEAVGDTRVAEALYRDAIIISEENSGPFTKLGLLLLKKDQPQKAVSLLQKAIEVNHQDREARRILVKYYSLYQPAQVEPLLQVALDDSPDDIEWLSLLANHYSDLKQKEKAAAIYQQIVESHPDVQEAHRFLSIYYLKKNDWDGAVSQLENLLRVNPKDRLALRNLGLAEYKRGQFQAAKRYLSELIRQDDGDALTYYLMGSIYRQAGRTYLAVEHFSEAKKRDADMVEAHLGLASSLLKIKDLERAEKVLREASSRFPKIAPVWINFGLALIRQKEPQQALEAFQKAEKLSPDDAWIYFHQGRAYHDLDQFEETVRVWKKALRLKPDFADVYNHLGYIYVEKGKQLKQAIRWIKKALALQPANGYYLDSLGWAYYKQGHYQKALEQLLASRDIFLKEDQVVDSVIYDHLGDVYYQLKKFSDAEESWKNALDQDPDNQVIRKKIKEMKKQKNGVGDENA